MNATLNYPREAGRPRNAAKAVREMAECLGHARRILALASTWQIPADVCSDDLLDTFDALGIDPLSESAVERLCIESFGSHSQFHAARWALFLTRCLAKFASLVVSEGRDDFITPAMFDQTTRWGGSIVVWDLKKNAPEAVREAVRAAHPSRIVNVPNVGRPGLILCRFDEAAIRLASLTVEVK